MAPLYCSQGHENSTDSRFCRRCGEPLSAGQLLHGGSAGHAGNAGHAGIVGQILGFRYRVVQELGQGGFGRTYLAEDSHRFNERCVLKEFAPQVQGSEALQKAEELFAREAGVLYKLQHLQIPRFRELFRAEVQGKGRLFLVQDYIEGQTYQTILQLRQRQGRCFSEPEVVQLLFQLLPVLAYIHAGGVVHRDISPDNLILRSPDELPILIDFGGVKQLAATVASQANPIHPPAGVTLLGKLGYAPKEQMTTGEAFPHSDLYALAVTVLVLLTGKEPQELLATSQQPWQQQLRRNPALVDVLERMLHPQPTRRYQSAQEVLQALNAQQVPPTPLPLAQLGQTSPPISPTMPVGAGAGAIPPSRTAGLVTPPEKRGFPILPVVGGLLLFAGTSAGGWWVGKQWLTGKFPNPQPTETKTSSPTPSLPAPQYSKAEQERKQANATRREQLGIEQGFLTALVDKTFRAKYGDRNLTDKPEDDDLRAQWDAIAKDYLTRLANLSPDARSRLGSYTPADRDNRIAEVNKLNLSSRALNDLTDGQFFELFPEQSRNSENWSVPMQQIWQAIATDKLRDLQTGKSLERIQFAPGEASQQMKGTLQPGQGKAYIARLSKDQMLQLKLQAPEQATLLSFYQPKNPQPLLADSTTMQWSGKLTESGFYEVIVVSSTKESVQYQIDLSAANSTTENPGTPP